MDDDNLKQKTMPRSQHFKIIDKYQIESDMVFNCAVFSNINTINKT